MEYTNLVEVLNIIGQTALEEYKDKIKKGAYATGTLFNNVKYRIDITDNGVKFSFVDLPDYYINVENGRKPNGKFPPIEVIRKWMIVKKIPDKPGVAFLIARSISKKGIKPKPYLREIKTEIKNNYSDDIISAIKKDIELSIKNINKNDNKK